jgi:hypothetical protein
MTGESDLPITLLLVIVDQGEAAEGDSTFYPADGFSSIRIPWRRIHRFFAFPLTRNELKLLMCSSRSRHFHGSSLFENQAQEKTNRSLKTNDLGEMTNSQ